MDKAQVLVRMVARAFYDTEAVVIIDSLVRHIALNLSDLQFIFQNSAKGKGVVQTQCGILKSAGLVSVFTRQETKAGAQKPTNVDYFYIDYRRAVDATKYRLHTLESQLRKKAGPADEKKDYRCPRCKSEFKELDVIGNPSPDFTGFLCIVCQHLLDYVQPGEEDQEMTGPVGLFNKHFKWLIDLMVDIDKLTVPATNAETAFASREELPRPKAPLEGPKIEVTSVSTSKPTAVVGLVTGPQKIEVSITSDDDNTAAAAIAAAEQKQRLAAQNALPEWYTKSTISNEMTAVGQKEELARREREAEIGVLTAENVDEKKAVTDDGLDDIFAQIQREQAMEQAKREAEEDEEDEEFEFEDIPSASNPADANSEGAPEAKKIKLDVSTPVSQATPAGSAEADESEEEFEDV